MTASQGFAGPSKSKNVYGGARHSIALAVAPENMFPQSMV
jgi:hypothetical protein